MAELCVHCLEYVCECTREDKDRRNGTARTTHISLDGVFMRFKKSTNDRQALRAKLPGYMRSKLYEGPAWSNSSSFVAVKGEVLIRDQNGWCWPIDSEVLLEKLTEADRIARRQRREK